MDGAYGLPDRLGAPSPVHDMAHSGPQMSQEEMDELMGAAR
jgi:hypothetical protein